MQVKVILKSGATVEFQADRFIVDRDPESKAPTSIEWNQTHSRGLTLLYLHPDEIAAVLTDTWQSPDR